MTKRLAALLVCLILAVSLLPAQAHAADAALLSAESYDFDSDGTGFTYETLEDGTLRITDCSASGQVRIPSSINGVTVTELAPELFFTRFDVTSVNIPSTIHAFGYFDYVFSYCYALQAINVSPANPELCSVDGVLFTKDMRILYNYPVAKAGTRYTTPAETYMLCCTSFASQKNLTELNLQNKDTYWMTYTFYNTPNLTINYLPGGRSETYAINHMNSDLSHMTSPDRYPTYRKVDFIAPEAPEITGNPVSVTTAPGANPKFTVSASGRDLSYQWQYQMPGSTTWTNTTLTGCNTPQLTVPATAARNGCKYRCVVTDGSGTTLYSGAASLTVTGVITITGHPGAKTVNAGSTAQFGVIAYGAGLKYQWQYQLPGSTTWTNTTLTGYNTSLLSVPVTAARNGCKYRCVVTCSTGATKATNPATLTVAGVLTITGHPGTKTVALNSTAQFGVIATGTGLTYQWQYQLPGSSTWTNTTLTGCKTSLLSVPATAARNGCKYRCVVKDSSGKTAYSNPATMTISGVITIAGHPGTKTVAAGSTAQFGVIAYGAGLSYQWQYQLPGSSAWTNTTLTGAKTSLLSVPATAARNGCKYRCVVTCSTGAAKATNPATLTVK